MNAKLFTVISGDMVRSRLISQRNRFSQKLGLVLETTNNEFHEELFAPITVTKGIDEISAVLKRPDLSYLICRTLNSRIYPHFFRFAIVTDVLDVGLNTRDARQMDGNAFHLASHMLLLGKKKNKPYFFKVSADTKELDSLLEELTNLIHITRLSWTPKQYRMIQLYCKLENQVEVAKKLKITQQAVSDSLKKSNFEDLKVSEESVDALLKTKLIYKLKSL